MGNVKQQDPISKDRDAYDALSAATLNGKNDIPTFHFSKRTKKEIAQSRNPAYRYMIK